MVNVCTYVYVCMYVYMYVYMLVYVRVKMYKKNCISSTIVIKSGYFHMVGGFHASDGFSVLMEPPSQISLPDTNYRILYIMKRLICLCVCTFSGRIKYYYYYYTVGSMLIERDCSGWHSAVHRSSSPVCVLCGRNTLMLLRLFDCVK